MICYLYFLCIMSVFHCLCVWVLRFFLFVSYVDSSLRNQRHVDKRAGTETVVCPVEDFWWDLQWTGEEKVGGGVIRETVAQHVHACLTYVWNTHRETFNLTHTQTVGCRVARSVSLSTGQDTGQLPVSRYILLQYITNLKHWFNFDWKKSKPHLGIKLLCVDWTKSLLLILCYLWIR